MDLHNTSNVGKEMKNVLFIHGEKNQLHSIREVLKSNGYTDFRFILCRDMQDVQKILRDYDINCIFYEIVNSRFLRELEYLRKIARDLPKIVCGERLGKKELVGIINAGSVFHYLEKPFKEQDFVDAIKDSVAFNEGIKEKYIEIQKVYFQQQVEKLNNIGIALSSEHKLEKLLDRIVSQSLFLAHCDAGSIYTVDGSMLSFNVARNNTLKKRYGNGYEDKCFKRYHIPINMDRISGYVAATGETLNIKDVYRIGPDKKYTFTDDFDRRNNYKTQSMITSPLKDSEGNILGVLQLINCMNMAGKIIPFDKNLESLIKSLASQAAVAIRNARLIEKVKEVHLDTILRLSVTAEFRDVDTSDHLRRMTNYSLIIAKSLGLNDDELELLKYAAPMHDIGKIGIPDSILFKPGRLTWSEMEEMKNHSIYGAQILEGSDSVILKASSIVALNHHERWNGKGYPQGLKYDDIPLFGQIVSVADVFDALTSKRSYKEAYDPEHSIEEIEAGKNSMFGQHIVDAFMNGLDEIIEVFEESRKKVIGGEYLHKGKMVEAYL